MTIGMADDVPPNIADRVIARQVLSYTEKPYVFCCKDLNSLRDIYEMALLITGSEENFLKAPNIVQFTQPIAPLVHADSSLDKLIESAEKGIPITYYSAVMAGGTSLATFAGSLAQASAESLSGLVVGQSVRPGSPFIYGSFTSLMDMRTSVFSYGAPEVNLMTAAMTQMAQRYRLPFFGTAGCSDAKFPDGQAGAEAAFSCLNSFLSGSNLVHDPGWLDHGSLASPAYIVLVHEIIEMIQPYMKGIPVNEETLNIDLLEKVGPGGQFLTEDHTLEHFKDVWYPGIFDRSDLEQWKTAGSTKFDERLREQTLKVMEHQPEPLPDNILKEMDLMAKQWK
jgi:trimethylamine--corrinoid protein Co-methyltransferase